MIFPFCFSGLRYSEKLKNEKSENFNTSVKMFVFQKSETFSILGTLFAVSAN